MSRPIPESNVDILLVEDSLSDARLTGEAFREVNASVRLTVVHDGDQALSLLRREGQHGRAPRPQLILLDLNLPGKDGREVLAEVKSDPVLGRIPVIVLTTSNADVDVRRAYDLHANCYVRKPLDFAALVDVVRTVDAFWVRTAVLPPCV